MGGHAALGGARRVAALMVVVAVAVEGEGALEPEDEAVDRARVDDGGGRRQPQHRVRGLWSSSARDGHESGSDKLYSRPVKSS